MKLPARTLVGVVGALSVLAIAAIAVQKYRAERQLFFPQRQPASLSVANSGIEAHRMW